MVVSNCEIRFPQDLPRIREQGLKRREERVSFWFGIDEGEVEVGAVREELSVDVGTAADPDLTLVGVRGLPEFVDVSQNPGSRNGNRAPGQHKGLTAGERAADGVPGAAPHHEDTPEGGTLEPLEVGWQVPGDPVALADDPVSGHGGNRLPRSHAGCEGEGGNEKGGGTACAEPPPGSGWDQSPLPMMWRTRSPTRLE